MNAWHGAGIAIVTLAAVAPPAASSRQAEASYADLVARYRGGDFDGAVKAVSALRASTLENERRMLDRIPFGNLRDEDVTAAIMLHTEAHFDSGSGRIAHLPSPHLESARRLSRRCLELLDAPPSPTDSPTSRRAREIVVSLNAREFVRQWYLLLGSHFQGMRHVSRSAHYLQEARFLFPDDPDILLASGSHHELLTFIGNERLPLFDSSGSRLRDQMIDIAEERRAAAGYFRAALAANPSLEEARLRLGRAVHLLGDLDAATRELDPVRTDGRNSALKYLAGIFLALVEEDRGRRRRAAELYVEAMKEFPAAQTSYVGLSELLYMDSQPDQAETVMKALLERPAPRDPWWSYMMGEWWHFDTRLAALRKQVRL